MVNTSRQFAGAGLCGSTSTSRQFGAFQFVRK
jgi:hypothetical protein